MKQVYDIYEDEMLSGDVSSEITETGDGYHWSYEYTSDKYYKHIEAELGHEFDVRTLECEMSIGGTTVSSSIEKSKDNRADYLINQKAVHCNNKIAVFEMIFLLGYAEIFENCVLYNTINNEFLPINIKGENNKITVLYPCLSYIVLKNNRVQSCVMPRDEMRVIARE